MDEIARLTQSNLELQRALWEEKAKASKLSWDLAFLQLEYNLVWKLGALLILFTFVVLIAVASLRRHAERPPVSANALASPVQEPQVIDPRDTARAP
jgi:hypothetical protein